MRASQKKFYLQLLFILGVVIVTGLFNYPFSGNSANEQSNTSSAKPIQGDFVLALSWQPAFCETRPNVPECRSQRKERYDANNFSLHGLWPQPINNTYCDVPNKFVSLDKQRKWSALPKLDLDAAMVKSLSTAMPGYRSNLHRHEWFKHGTCFYVASPQVYFDISLKLLAKINNSAIGQLFKQNQGREISSRQLLKAMDKAFGKENRYKIKMSCKRDGSRNLISEILISFSGSVSSHSPNAQKLVDAAPDLRAGCKSGIIDRVGLQ